MAKIYETQRDFERDKLKDQTADMRFKSVTQSGLGLASMLGATIVDDFNPKKTTGLRLASVALTVVGIVEIVKSLFTASKAHDLKLKKELLGPQAVVFPPETSDSGVMAMNAGTSCSKCKHTQTIQPTSLLEQAVRSDAAIERK